MKVAFVVHEFPVLSETFVINQVIGLLDRGCEVDIYTTRIGDVSKMHPEVKRYDLLSRVRVLPGVPQNYALRLLRAGGVVARYGWQYPRQILRSLNPMSRGLRAASLWSLFSAVPAMDWPTYDIIHCQFGNLGFHGQLLRDFSPNACLVVMFRGFDISQQVQSESEGLYASLFKRADYFLTNCEFFKRRLIALGCPIERVRVHYSGLDCAKFPLKLRTYDVRENQPIQIAATGRLVEKKGFEYCIRAIAKVPPRYPVILTIMGDGPLKAELSGLIESLNLSQRVRLLGWCDEAEIIDVLERSHLFVAPSVTSSEGNQDAPINVLKEAMAMGLPVISTDHGGIPELVEDGVSGLLVPERDADAIAQAIVTLINQPERWIEMGKAGRRYVEIHYDLHGLNDRLLDLYHELSDDFPEDKTNQPVYQGDYDPKLA
jgi:colanic acid/amylovoran biosynthesis glycosyltransferase